MQERVRGERYDALVDEVVAALRARYGTSLLLHWEDFAASNAFRLLAKYQAQARRPFKSPNPKTLPGSGALHTAPALLYREQCGPQA